MNRPMKAHLYYYEDESIETTLQGVAVFDSGGALVCIAIDAGTAQSIVEALNDGWYPEQVRPARVEAKD